jgi:hypothetical protein
MTIQFDENATQNPDIEQLVNSFFSKTPTLETKRSIPVVIFQDGVKGAYYVKCSIKAKDASPLFDFNAKLESLDSFRANRELLLEHLTFQKMVIDASNGREFNDIIVEYSESYTPEKPLKIWGGQHRSRALIEAKGNMERYHGFKIYFGLTTDQRTETALISNTNISVSNDTFDRMLEETLYGDVLRRWCQQSGLLSADEDFPDVGSKFDKITVKLARTFVVNFYLGKENSAVTTKAKIDKTVHEPYLAETGTGSYLAQTTLIDPKYRDVMEKYGKGILTDQQLLQAGKSFSSLHSAQQKAVRTHRGKIKNSKSFRNKAFVESILAGWSYVAGLLQSDDSRLQNHYRIPKTTSKIPDPLNAAEMSKFKHDNDPKTYRGLGTRSSLKDRQRVAHLFLAKSLEHTNIIDKKLMNRAVSQVVGLNAMKKGYTDES